MYNLKYRIPFVSITEESYEIQILENGYSGAVTTLTGGTPPIIIEYNDEDFLYTPLRFAGATINIVGQEYLQDLYSNNYQQNKVNLYKGSQILYTGFITPEIYTQENNGYLTTIELESVSALATLDNYLFETNLPQITLHQLIKDALVASKGDYQYVYIPRVWNGQNTMKNFAVSSGNFIDEEGERMTYKEILEEIAKFYNLTITEKNGSVYFIDIDYVKGGNTSYYRYDGSMGNENVVTLSNSIQHINDSSSTGFNNTLSIVNSYSKVTVIDSDYELDKNILFKEFDWSTRMVWGDGYIYEKDKKRYYYHKDLYNDGHYEYYQYKLSGNNFISTSINLGNPQVNAGASLMRLNHYDMDERPNSLTYEDILQVKLYDGESPTDATVTMTTKGASAFPIMKYSMNQTVTFERNQVLAIDFQIFYCDADDGFPIEERSNKEDKLHQNYIPSYFTPIRLRVGNKYYTGNLREWTTTPTTFNVQTQFKKDDHFANNWRNVENENDFLYNVPDLNGKLVWFDEDTVGDLELTIYCPQQFADMSGFHYHHRYTFIKNFTLKSQKSNGVNKQSKEDTTYTNVISDRYLNEADDIELKITSKNSSELSFSKVIDTSNQTILDTVDSYYMEDAKPEHLIINKIVNQYQTPKIKLEEEVIPTYNLYQMVSMGNLLDRTFIITSESINYEYNTSILTLIELQ